VQFVFDDEKSEGDPGPVQGRPRHYRQPATRDRLSDEKSERLPKAGTLKRIACARAVSVN